MRGSSWNRGVFVADALELQEHRSRSLHVKRINAKEVIVVKDGDTLMFPCANGMIELGGEDSEVRTSDQIRQGPEKREEHSSDQPGEEDETSDLAEHEQ